MNAPLTGPTWYWLAGTISLVLVAWVLLSTVLGAAAGVLLGLGARRRKDQAAASPPARDPQPAPGPAPLTGAERDILAVVAAARPTMTEEAVRNGQRVADGLRLLCPEVPDAALGRIALDTLRWLTTALTAADHDHRLAVKITADAYGLAAEDLTRLARQPETPEACHGDA